MALPLTDLFPSFGGEKKLTACLLLLILELFLEGAEAVPNQADIQNHLELGKQFLAKGQLSDALTHYHAAVEGDPNNYLTLFKRGTIYLALGKTRFAIQDFTKVLEIKPDFTSARQQRGLVYMKTGEYRLAANDFQEVLNEGENDEVTRQLKHLVPDEEQWKIDKVFIQVGDNSNVISISVISRMEKPY